MSQHKKFSYFAFTICCLLFISACSENNNNGYSDPALASSSDVEVRVAGTDISRATLKGMEPSNRLLLDVRTPEEYQDGYIMDAVNIPVTQLPDQLEYLSEITAEKSDPIVVYCRSGKRAQRAIDFLSSQGYSNLMHLEGDFGGWETANEEVSMQQN